MEKRDYISLTETTEDKEKNVSYEYELLLPVGAHIDEAIKVVMKFLKILQFDRDAALKKIEEEVEAPEKKESS